MIALNQRGLYDAYRRQMEHGGRWPILFSYKKEFIAGDGFLHNFRPKHRDHAQVLGNAAILPVALPALSKVKAADVKRSDVADLIGRLCNRPTAANHCLSLLRKMFNLAELCSSYPTPVLEGTRSDPPSAAPM